MRESVCKNIKLDNTNAKGEKLCVNTMATHKMFNRKHQVSPKIHMTHNEKI